MRVLGAMAAVVVLTSCKVDVHVGVRVYENGSGSVVARFVLDRAAIDAIGGDFEEQLRVADLIQAGWDVQVEAGKDGGAEAVAEKPFNRPEELTAIIDELSGDIGPFRDFRLTRERSTFRTDFTFAGRVDLETGIGASSIDPEDEAVRVEIEEEGVGVEELREFLKERVDEVFTFEVVAYLPGGGEHNAPEDLAGAPQWAPQVGEVVELKAESSLLATDRVALVVIGAGLGLTALAILLGVRFRHRAHEPRPSPARPRSPAPGEATPRSSPVGHGREDTETEMRPRRRPPP